MTLEAHQDPDESEPESPSTVPDRTLMDVIGFLVCAMSTPKSLWRRMLILLCAMGHLSQSDVARKLGVSHTAIWKAVAKARLEINQIAKKRRVG